MLQVLGQQTQPIPFNTDVGYLQGALMQLNFVGSVSVTMSVETDGLTRVCGNSLGNCTTDTRFYLYIT